MNLFRETLNALDWVQRGIRSLLSLSPLSMFLLVVSTLLGRVFTLLAFFLPLKVILLAGSEGVPRYFAFFIDPADKLPWIIGLSIGAVAFYLLSLLFDALSDRVAASGSGAVMAATSGISRTTDQMAESKDYYSDFGDICGSLFFFVAGMSVLFLIDPWIVLLLVVLMVAQYLFSALLLRIGNVFEPGPVLRLMLDKTQFYLNVFYSINFLAGFFILLIPYLQGSQRNLLLAILALLVIRQSLKGAMQVISNTAQLYQKRTQVDPYVFQQRKEVQRDRIASRVFRQVFQREAREAQLSERLGSLGFNDVGLSTSYVDFGLRNAYAFKLEVLERSSDRSWFLMQQVYSQKSISFLDHEDLLFEHVSRESLMAPRMRDRFSQRGFECQVVEFGEGRFVDKSDWPDVCVHLISQLWALEPPTELVTAFRTSRSTLEGRLTADYLERMAVALDSKDAEYAYATLLDNLDSLVEVVKRVPLCIHNPAIAPPNVARFGDDDWRVMVWHRWSIEHVGVEVPGVLQGERLEEVLSSVRKARGLTEDQLRLDHVDLVRNCRMLELEIDKDNYNQALSVAGKIVSNPLITGRAQAA